MREKNQTEIYDEIDYIVSQKNFNLRTDIRMLKLAKESFLEKGSSDCAIHIIPKEWDEKTQFFNSMESV